MIGIIYVHLIIIIIIIKYVICKEDYDEKMVHITFSTINIPSGT